MILSDLWMNYRDDDGFEDFISYNDLGLPLAHFAHNDLVKLSDQATMFVEETYNLFCVSLGLDLEKDYESLEEMFLDSKQ